MSGDAVPLAAAEEIRRAARIVRARSTGAATQTGWRRGRELGRTLYKDPEQIADNMDPRPAQVLRKAGLVDVAAVVGDTTPTVGYRRSDQLAYRCDQVQTSLARETISGYRVITGGGTEDKPLSDHRPVVAEFDLKFDLEGNHRADLPERKA